MGNSKKNKLQILVPVGLIRSRRRGHDSSSQTCVGSVLGQAYRELLRTVMMCCVKLDPQVILDFSEDNCGI